LKNEVKTVERQTQQNYAVLAGIAPQIILGERKEIAFDTAEVGATNK
jgi:hypothetical protein